MEKLVVIVGPTAVGKTKISIDLAKLIHTEIISGDSMLVYKGFDIGTAKPSMEERQGIPHYLINCLSPTAEYSVADFQTQAAYYISQINQKNKIPILAGGTGLYVKALLEGYNLNYIAKDDLLREELNRFAEIHGEEALHRKLEQVDSQAANKLHPHDRKRVIRALEVNYITGQPIAKQQDISNQSSLLYNTIVIGLTMDRPQLYDRINQRVEKMIDNGLISEVENLLNQGVPESCQAMQGIGYKEIVSYLNGQTSLDAAVSLIKQSTRRFAKRQLTWFKRMPYIQWYEVQPEQYNANNLLETIYKQVAGKFFLQ